MMIYQLPELSRLPKISHGFSTREGGNMSFKWGELGEVKTNRKKFLEELGLKAGDGITAELVHGDTIVRVGKKDAGHGILAPDYQLNVDGLITDEPGLFLFHVVADCLSLLFYDPTHQAIGLAHAGWKGTDLKLAEKMVSKFKSEFGTKPTDLIVALGPSIHRCCLAFENPVQASLPAWQPFLTKGKNDLTYINVVGYNLYQLTEAGVEQENIFPSEYCTAHSGKFFSHYQDQKGKKPEARFGAVVGLVERL